MRAGLATAGALQLSGRWWSVDPTFLDALLDLVALTAQSLGADLSRIPQVRG